MEQDNNFEKEELKEYKFEKFIFKYRGGILFIGLIFILFMPWLFTRNLDWIDFTTTGQIGDTIGGITAPIVNLLGAFLVYISFRAQMNANKIQQDALNEEKDRTRKRDNFKVLFQLIKENQESITKLHAKHTLSEFSEDLAGTISNNLENVERLNSYIMNHLSTEQVLMVLSYNFEILFMTLEKLFDEDLFKKDRVFLLELCEIFYCSQLKDSFDFILGQYDLINTYPLDNDLDEFFYLVERINDYYSRHGSNRVNYS